VQPFAVTVEVLGVAVTGPHASLTVALPKAESMAEADGLQAVIFPFAGVPVAVITGAVTSNVQVAVREVLDELPQPSVAVHVLV